MYRFFKALERNGALLPIWTVLAICLLLPGCGMIDTIQVGQAKTETKIVELGPASTADVEINLSAGELTVAGGAQELMDATFHYNVDDWQPNVDYKVENGLGKLLVEQPNNIDGVPISPRLVNSWAVLLNNSVPLELTIDTGAGKTNLDLRGLDLQKLQVKMGAGRTTIDLSSALDHDVQAEFEGGVGDLSVKLPAGMGVQISAASGLGGQANTGLIRDGDYWVNKAFGVSPHTLYLDIQSGVGGIELLTN
jgi:N-terminal domain of toast_rack, DUF2154